MENFLPTAQDLRIAFAEAMLATKKVFTATANLQNAKDLLEKNILTSTANGLITGTNEVTRKASAFTQMPHLFEAVDQAEVNLKEAGIQLKEAENVLALYRDLLRLGEIVTSEGYTRFS